jgi:hypothetical protein
MLKVEAQLHSHGSNLLNTLDTRSYYEGMIC